MNNYFLIKFKNKLKKKKKKGLSFIYD